MNARNVRTQVGNCLVSNQEAVGKEFAVVRQERVQFVQEAYARFRQKWDPTMPPHYASINQIDFGRLRNVPPPQEGEYQPRLTPDDAVVEQL
jgi:hypothetical protein